MLSKSVMFYDTIYFVKTCKVQLRNNDSGGDAALKKTWHGTLRAGNEQSVNYNNKANQNNYKY